MRCVNIKFKLNLKNAHTYVPYNHKQGTDNTQQKNYGLCDLMCGIEHNNSKLAKTCEPNCLDIVAITYFCLTYQNMMLRYWLMRCSACPACFKLPYLFFLISHKSDESM